MGNCLACFKSPGSNATTNATSTLTDNPTILRQQQVYSDIDENRDETKEFLLSSPTTNSSERKNTLLTNGNLGTFSTEVVGGNLKDNIQSDNAFNKLFEEYKDDQEDAILTEGIERLCNDLGYKPDDFAILVLAWRLDASEMFQFTRQEFIQGMANINAATVQDIKLRLNQIIEKLKTDAEMFKLLYRFTFKFGLEPGHRILSLDMAIILWRLVFTVHTPAILQRWLDFLEQPQHNIRGITKDTWYMFLNFAECDIMTYDDTEAWPSLFDDFVDYEKERTNNNNSS